MTEKDLLRLLQETKVANEYAHWEDGELKTCITSLDELQKFAEECYQLGYWSGREQEENYWNP